MPRGFDQPREQIESAREHHDEQIEKGCGCVWCDIGTAIDQDGKHPTERGIFPCTRER